MAEHEWCLGHRDSRGDPGICCQVGCIARTSHSISPFGDGLELWMPIKRGNSRTRKIISIVTVIKEIRKPKCQGLLVGSTP